MKPLVLLLLLLGAFAHAQNPAVVSPDDTAKFLAGLPVRGTGLEPLSRDHAWVEHATEFDKAWATLDSRQLAKIRAWGPEFLADEYTSKSPVLYFYSGPDILYANTFYPNASTYVLAGLEPVGTPPDLLKMPPGALAAGLANLRKSLNSVLSFSFFITKDMKVDLQQNQLSGTLPVLYVFLSRAGCKIDNVELVWLDKSGAISTTKTAVSGVRITFFGPSGAQQMLYYFSTNLANDGIKTQPGFTKFCEQLGPSRSLVKAASYLMHMNEFSASRDFLLGHCTAIVEDDSGIPLKFFEPSRWSVRLFGSYPGPIDLFKQYYQHDLADVYSKSHPPALPFGFGYQWHPSRSSLLLATPKAPTVRDSPPTAPNP